MPEILSPSEHKSQATALKSLAADGAHFVLLKPNSKRPLWKGYQLRRPSLDLVIYHSQIDGHGLGIYPASVGTSALDIDYGDIGELITHHPPLADLPTRRGHHLYYRDSLGRRNAKFDDLFGCRGDVRSARGYLKLHPGGALRLAEAKRLASAVGDWGDRFPADLFELSGVPVERQPVPERGGGAAVLPHPTVAAPDAPADAVSVSVGYRHIWLFDNVRFWSYRQVRGDNLADWIATVDAYAQSQNDRLRTPQSTDEVYRCISYSIATWVWPGGGAQGHQFDHSTAAQRRRIIKRHHGSGSEAAVEAVAARDARIIELHQQGVKQRLIASEMGLTPGRVSQILRAVRERANLGQVTKSLVPNDSLLALGPPGGVGGLRDALAIDS